FLPIFMILFGLGDTSKIILIVAIAVFQIIISTRDGVKEISKDIFLSAKSLKLSNLDILLHIVIPSTLPKFFTSLRIVLGSSMAALFFAENYATKFGIGYFIMNAWVKVDYVEMYAGIISISFFGIILFKTIDYMQNKFCHWKNY
ncbi:MAG TPA: ABC transporter permease, partial [Firmicutes bacterium]|nr:ABC transporter permease [Bacillota bacterium]